MWRRVVCYLVANIPNEHSSQPSWYVLLQVRPYKLLLSHLGSHRPWRRRRHVAPKCDETPTTQHGVTSCKTTLRCYWIFLITNDSSYPVSLFINDVWNYCVKSKMERCVKMTNLRGCRKNWSRSILAPNFDVRSKWRNLPKRSAGLIFYLNL